MASAESHVTPFEQEIKVRSCARHPTHWGPRPAAQTVPTDAVRRYPGPESIQTVMLHYKRGIRA